jgi:uncharacterized protein YjlB
MVSVKLSKPETYVFADDGSVPNNPRLPLLIYRGAIDLIGTHNPEEDIEKVVRANRWGGTWRNGIYPYLQYHSMIHEGMGIARGRVKVRFGGQNGKEIDLTPGDVVVVPAGTGHQGVSSTSNLMVIGSYANGGRYDLCRGSRNEYTKALETISQVPLPDRDPVFGKQGPLLQLWQS